MAKRRKSRSSARGFGGGEWGDLLAYAAYGAAGEGVVDSLTGGIAAGMNSNLKKGVVGYLAKKNMPGFLGKMGQAALNVAAYSFGKENKFNINLAGTSTGSSSSSSTQAATW